MPGTRRSSRCRSISAACIHPTTCPSFAGTADLGRARLGLAAAHRHPHPSLRLGHRANHLDGRPSASAGIRAAHVDGILHRQVGRRHPRRHDHASEGRLDASQRPDAQRLGDGHRAPHPSRRHADARHLGGRSRVLHRAGRSHRATTSTKSTATSAPIRAKPVEEIIRPKGRDSASSARARTRSSASIAKAHGIPPEAARGGAETMYPEYRKKLGEMMKAMRRRR